MLSLNVDYCDDWNDRAAGSYNPFKSTEGNNPSTLVRDRINASLDILAIRTVWTASRWCAPRSALSWKSSAWRLGRIASGRFAAFVKFACSSWTIGMVNGLMWRESEVWWPPSKRRGWCQRSTPTTHIKRIIPQTPPIMQRQLLTKGKTFVRSTNNSPPSLLCWSASVETSVRGKDLRCSSVLRWLALILLWTNASRCHQLKHIEQEAMTTPHRIEVGCTVLRLFSSMSPVRKTDK